MKKKTIPILLLGLGALLLAVWYFNWSSTTQLPTTLPSAGSSPSSPDKAEAALNPKTGPSDAAPAMPRAIVLPQKKFSEMSALEANAQLQEIGRQDIQTIFRAMLDAERVQHDNMKRQGLQTTLTWAMRTRGMSSAFIQLLQDFLVDPQSTRFEKQLLIGALGEAGTQEALDLLISTSIHSPDPALREQAKGGIGAVGKSGNRALAQTLDKLWRDEKDEELLRSAGRSMARLGVASSIELLLDAALAQNDREVGFRSAIARSNLSGIYQTTAVPPLAARLTDLPPAGDAAQLVTSILVGIGNPAAANAVISWLQGLSEDATPLITGSLIQQTRTPAMLAAWKAALEPAVAFRNGRNREAIKAALLKREAGRHHE